MDHPRPRPAVPTAASMPQPAPHQIHLCQTCRHTGRPCGPGLALLERLRGAIALTGLGGEFELSGTACLTGCSRPCLVAWRASVEATWFFGDIDPADDIEDLVALATLCRRREPEGCDRPEQPGDTNPAQRPAAIIVTRAGVIQ